MTTQTNGNGHTRSDARIRIQWFLGGMFLFLAAFLIVHFNHFLVPESDFFDYAEKAVQLRHLEWPDNFKRPPLTSLLIAFISPLIPGKFAELYAAEIISAVSALLALWFLWRIARHLHPGAAPWVVWLWALHSSTLKLAIKPKGEFLFVCLLLWAFDRFLRRDERAYGIGFFSTLVRYEGAMAIGAFAFADLLLRKQRIKTIVTAALSLSFLIAWSLLQDGGDGGGSYADYFHNWKPNLGFFPAFWSELLQFLPLAWYRIGAAAAALFFIWGGLSLWRRHRRATLAMGTYLAGFAALHVIWPFPGADYLIMASWVAILLICAGLFDLAARVKAALARRGWLRPLRSWHLLLLTAAAVAAAVALYYGLRRELPYPQYQPQLEWVALSLLPLIFYYRPARLAPANWLPVITAIAIGLLLSLRLAAMSRAELFDLYYSKAEFRLIGEWFQENYRKGDRMLVTQPNIVAYYTNLDTRRDFVRLADAPPLPPDQLHAWMRSQGITHAAWMSYSRKSEKKGAWHQWTVANRGLTLLDFLGETGSAPGFNLLQKLEAGPRRAAVYQVLNDYQEREN